MITSSVVYGETLSAVPVWSDSEKRVLYSLSLLSLPPLLDDRSNRYANNKQAQVLGEKIFFDKSFSANKQVACASCHQPERFFTDGKVRGVGVGVTDRNTPTVVGSGWSTWFYWDGRRDSLWAQALIPFEARLEMGSDRVAVVRTLYQNSLYNKLYRSVFGAFPAGLDLLTLPEHAGPLASQEAKNNWWRLSASERKLINGIYSNIGKAIAAYERTLKYQPTRFDRYVEFLHTGQNGMESAPTEDEIAGMRLFIDASKTQCLRCHNGPLLTNGGFHNVGSGNFTAPPLDFGRALGLQAVLMDEFNCKGNYSDARPEECVALRFLSGSHHVSLKGAYKTPSLRNLTATAPYFHDGRFTTIEQVLNYYNLPPENNGPHELKAMGLSELQLSQLVAFLTMLNNINLK